MPEYLVIYEISIVVKAEKAEDIFHPEIERFLKICQKIYHADVFRQQTKLEDGAIP